MSKFLACLLVVVAMLVMWPPRRVTGVGFSERRVTIPVERVRRFIFRRAGSAARRAAAVQWIDAVVGELRAGRPVRSALIYAEATRVAGSSRSGRATDALCPRTVGAARLGGDLAVALRTDAREQQLAVFGHVAACLCIAESSGAGLVVALDHVIASARADEEVRFEVESQLAAPRATARLLATLPIVGLLLGTALGAAPLRWLTGSLIGLATLSLGVLGVASGTWWTSRMVASIERDLAAG